jgi:hypothetical protein
MVDTSTPVLALVKPEVGASTDTWGPKLNANQDKIDALFTDATKKVLTVLHGGTGADNLNTFKSSLGLGALASLNTVGTAQIQDGAVTAAKLAAGIGSFPSGSRMLFQQTTPPVGWTKDTTHNNKTLRIVNAAVGAGGTQPFTTVFGVKPITGTVGSASPTGTIGSTALSISEMPVHGHPVYVSTLVQTSAQSDSTGGFMMQNSTVGSYGPNTGGAGGSPGSQIGGAGGGAGHTHTFTGTAHTHTLTGTSIDLTVQYVDFIIAQKD